MNEGDEDEFRRFVETRWGALVRTAYLLTGDHGRAEDLVQQTLVKVHRHWSGVLHRGSPYAYTRAALANESASYWRRKRVPETLFGATREDGPTRGLPLGFDRQAGDPTSHVDTRDQLSRAVVQLPPRMRAVIVLRYFDDLTEAETASALGMSVGSVKSQASRGLDRLRAVLGDDHARERSLR